MEENSKSEAREGWVSGELRERDKREVEESKEGNARRNGVGGELRQGIKGEVEEKGGRGAGEGKEEP